MKKCNFVFCIFTYADDAHMLGQCIRALRKLGASRNNIYIFDDDKKPLPYPPPNTQYTRTTFQRRGNLNGVQCVDGMLLCMKYAATASRADVVIKVDSDVIINNLEWVLENDYMNSICGFHIGLQNHISGCTYSLPTAALIPMLRKLKTYTTDSNTGESILVTMLAEDVKLKHVAYECNSRNSDLWKASSFYSDNVNNDGTISEHALLVMKNLSVVLGNLISPKRDKWKNFLLMRGYMDSISKTKN